MLALRAKAALIALSFAIGSTTANAFPDRSVRLIVPFPPGGVTDTAARLIGQQLSTKWGQPVVIENRPGAGGVIGVQAAVGSTPDGYTLLMATNGEITIHAAISAKPKYDAQKDLVPISMTTITPIMWATNLNSGIGSLADLVSTAKAKPNSITYSSAGLGSVSHIAMEQFAAAAGIKLLHVPYRGGAPAATALMSGEVAASAIAVSSVLTVADSGKVKLLAVASNKRSDIAPHVPTVNETGVLKNFQSSIWTAVFAPAGTPQDIVSKVEKDILETLKNPDLVARLNKVGAAPAGVPAAGLRAHIVKEAGEMKRIASEAKISIQ